MKRIIYISLLILSPVILLGQDKSPSLKEQTGLSKPLSEEGKEKQAALKNTVCEEPCPYDTAAAKGKERMQKMRRRMMDNFMDKDGDGINDCRAKGMQWQEKGKHKKYGKHNK